MKVQISDPEALLQKLSNLVRRGGPTPEEYDETTAIFNQIAFARGADESVSDGIKTFISNSSGAFDSLETMQGFVCLKPHGYHGDFEVIDRIYNNWISGNVHLERWDRYFHWHAAPMAVRNRKDYFKALMLSLVNETNAEFTVLNVASGPCRDLSELLAENPIDRLHVECVDHDPNAIDLASRLTRGASVTFHQKDIFRWRTTKQFRLVWSAGLFDYLNDRQAIHLLRKMAGWLDHSGQIIVGNFSTRNASRAYMEFGGWHLIHRTKTDLLQLAYQAGFDPAHCAVRAERLGVNLFLQIRPDTTLTWINKA